MTVAYCYSISTPCHVCDTTLNADKKSRGRFPDVLPQHIYEQSYLLTTCQPSSVLTSVTAAVALSLLTTAVTLHL